MHIETKEILRKQVQRNKEPSDYWNNPEYHYLVYTVNRILIGLYHAE